ncbi:hypothetical protein JXQ70_10570 [bacterium]|nr:hypothetical protein [bacterium]
MTTFSKDEIVNKLAQCMGIEKADALIDALSTELGFSRQAELTNEEMILLCDSMEKQGGFIKMMASVLKIQALLNKGDN